MVFWSHYSIDKRDATRHDSMISTTAFCQLITTPTQDSVEPCVATLSEQRRINGLDNCDQWRRQRSKGARSFRGQKVLKLGHSGALYFLKKS